MLCSDFVLYETSRLRGSLRVDERFETLYKWVMLNRNPDDYLTFHSQPSALTLRGHEGADLPMGRAMGSQGKYNVEPLHVLESRSPGDSQYHVSIRGFIYSTSCAG